MLICSSEDKRITQQTASIGHSQESFTAPITIDICDDVDDEAVMEKTGIGKNRREV